MDIDVLSKPANSQVEIIAQEVKKPFVDKVKPYIELTDKEMIEGLQMCEYYEEAFRIKNLKKENANLKRKLTILQRNTMGNKKRNKKIREKHELKLMIENNPDWCWCEEILSKPADVDYENDLVIGETEPIDGFPYYESKSYTLPLYKCKRCGKKHAISIVIA